MTLPPEGRVPWMALAIPLSNIKSSGSFHLSVENKDLVRTSVSMHFRSTEHVAQRLNLSTLYHDLIVQHLILSEQYFNNGDSFGGWEAFVTNSEFRKIASKNDFLSVDGVVRELDGTICAVEMEHSFKTPESRKNILLKYSDSLAAGYYQKIMLFSQKLDILIDTKRINEQALTYLTKNNRPESNEPWLSEEAGQKLTSALVYRTKSMTS